jgi:hypothetical protein
VCNEAHHMRLNGQKWPSTVPMLKWMGQCL